MILSPKFPPDSCSTPFNFLFFLIPQNKIKIDPSKPNKTEKKSPKQNKIKSPQNNTQTSLCLGQLPLAMGPALDCG